MQPLVPRVVLQSSSIDTSNSMKSSRIIKWLSKRIQKRKKSLTKSSGHLKLERVNRRITNANENLARDNEKLVRVNEKLVRVNDRLMASQEKTNSSANTEALQLDKTQKLLEHYFTRCDALEAELSKHKK